MTEKQPILALDTGSPIVSVAVGYGATILAERSIELKRSSEQLIAMIDEALSDSGTRLPDLGGIVALRGPGSFTGLRVGLATVLGFHQASGLPAGTVPTHHALAAWSRRNRPELTACLAVVDALRGEWFGRGFQWRTIRREWPTSRSRAAAEGLGPVAAETGSLDLEAENSTFAGLFAEAVPRLFPASEVARAKRAIVGFGAAALGKLAKENDLADGADLCWHEPDSLAAAAIELASHADYRWNHGSLTSPLYLRAPAVHGGRPQPSP